MKHLILIAIFSWSLPVISQDDLDLLEQFETQEVSNTVNLDDDLEALTKDLDEDVLAVEKSDPPPILSEAEFNASTAAEEKKLLELTQNMKHKLSDDEWKKVAKDEFTSRYVVQEGEWLWKISQKLFGSGFYYAKIWAMNPYITNPHLIKPGMILIFNTGDELNLPSVAIGNYTEEFMNFEDAVKKGKFTDLSYFGDEVESTWLKEREKLLSQKVNVEVTSEVGYQDLYQSAMKSLTKEYQKYTPPLSEIDMPIVDPNLYDETGLDRNSIVRIEFKEGFYLNTFINTNPIMDLGYVSSSSVVNEVFNIRDRIYVKFNSGVNPVVGGSYTLYELQDEINHPKSDRRGKRYVTVAQIKLIKAVDDLFEAEVFEVSSLAKRGGRITSFIPKIGRIFKNYSSRHMESIVVASFDNKKILYTGDVIYLDRGRADGVELGNLFEIFSNYDSQKNSEISKSAKVKIAEMVVISLSDNFSTALITFSKDPVTIGSIAITKSKESALAAKDTKKVDNAQVKMPAELAVPDITQDLLRDVNDFKVTDAELNDLEKSDQDTLKLTDHQQDMLELNRLEQDLLAAENDLNAPKVDEDKFLEDQSLELLEKDFKDPDPDALVSLDEIEAQTGKKYMDQDINEKENPYGLTANDLEEIDELISRPVL